MKFRPEEAEQGGVGLLSFTTELVADDAQLGKAKDYLVRQGVSEPHLVQVPWVGGKAVFAAALEEGDGFVEQLLGEITPDLAATNRALFSARLNEDGARLVEALVGMEGPSPLGVRYELEYDGLRPALDVRIRADYKRIYQELSWGFQFGVAYEGIGVRASVESATQKLIEAGAIEIDVLQFTDDASLRARVDDAIRWIEDRILEDFFKTSLQPAKQENLLDKAIAAAIKLGAATLQDALKDASLVTKIAEELGIPVDALKRLGQAASSGGGGSAGKASESTFALKLQFTFRDIHQEELKTITLDWREAHAERRTAAPQGLLSRIGGAPHIVEAADVGAFWDTLDVNVRPLGDFAALGVQRLVVQLAYPDETAPDKQIALTFERGEAGPKKFSAWTNGKPPRYRGRTEVHFDTEGAWPGPPVFIGEWQTLQSLELAVHPLTGVPRLEVEISPGTLKFAETPQAQVDLRLDGNIVATHMLSEAKPTATFRLRLESAEPPPGGRTRSGSAHHVVLRWRPARRGRVDTRGRNHPARAQPVAREPQAARTAHAAGRLHRGDRDTHSYRGQPIRERRGELRSRRTAREGREYLLAIRRPAAGEGGRARHSRRRQHLRRHAVYDERSGGADPRSRRRTAAGERAASCGPDAVRSRFDRGAGAVARCERRDRRQRSLHGIPARSRHCCWCRSRRILRRAIA